MKILFLCTGNSCRSQMAEGWGRHLAPEGVEVQSAGTHPVGLNPGATESMARAGVDISRQQSKQIDLALAAQFDYLVTLCGEADEECVSVSGTVGREHWPLADPAKATGTEKDVEQIFDSVRDEIKKRVEDFLIRIGNAQT
jgi:arsenate reductase